MILSFKSQKSENVGTKFDLIFNPFCVFFLNMTLPKAERKTKQEPKMAGKLVHYKIKIQYVLH